jgi:hypothetical protein
MGVKVTYSWQDMGWSEIKNKLTKLHNVEVECGVLGSEASKIHPGNGASNVTVGEVALINEFGTEDSGGDVPERSFMRDVTRRSNAVGQFGTVSATAARRIIHGASIEEGLSVLGKWGVTKIKENILSNTPPRQAEATIAKKGHAHTLIDTDTLYDSINFEIVPTTGGDDE